MLVVIGNLSVLAFLFVVVLFQSFIKHFVIHFLDWLVAVIYIQVGAFTVHVLRCEAAAVKALAHALDVSPDALTVPDIDTYIGLMHTLFALEDIYGLTIENRDDEIIMRIDPFKSREARNLLDDLPGWCAEREKYRKGEISKDDYDKWRYNYPKYDTSKRWVKVPSKELSDALIEGLRKEKN